MIYLVSKQQSLFGTDSYKSLSPEDAIAILSKERLLGADTETEGLNPVTKNLLTVQLGTEKFQIVWDCTSYPVQMLKELLENPGIRFIWTNYAFDSMFLLKEGIVQKNWFDLMIGERVLNNGYPRDAYSVSLKAMALKYCNYDMDKTARGEIISVGLTERTIVYSATDVKFEIDIYHKQREALKKKEVLRAAEFESKFTIVVGYTKLCGVRLDVGRWKKKMAKDQAEMAKYLKLLNDWLVNYYESNRGDGGYIEKQVVVDTQYIHYGDKNIPEGLKLYPPQTVTDKSRLIKKEDANYGFLVLYTMKIPFGYIQGDKFHPYIKYVRAIQQDLFAETDNTFGNVADINWSSSQQVIPLFELLGFNVDTIDKKTKTPKKSVDVKLIKGQKDINPTFVEYYIGYKEAAKICEAFGETFLKSVTPEDGRIHADFNPIGADTLRMSCGGRKGSVNLQQLPNDAETRSCFVSEPLSRWVSVDYAAQESRLIASVTGDKAMLHIYDPGECADMHSLVAYMAYKDQIPRDTPVKDIKKKYHDLRQKAKGIEFAINYGGSATTISSNMGIPIEEATKLYNSYMEGFSGNKAYQDYCRKIVMEKGYIQLNNVTGAKAFVFDWDWIQAFQKRMEEPDFWSTYRNDYDLSEQYRKYKKIKSDLGKKSINYRIQNRGACCFKLASMLFFKWILEKGYLGKVKMCIPCHDEWNIEAPDEIADEAAKKLLECFEKGAKPFCTKLPLPGDLATLPDGSLPTYWIH